MFLMKNRKCACIFADMDLVEQAMLKESGKAPCFAHGQLCVLPPAEESLYVCGFDLEKASQDSFGGSCLGRICKRIGTRKPSFSWLETSTPIKSTKAASEALASTPGCTIAQFESSAHPLPTSRSRSCWYVSRVDGEDANELKEEREKLQDKVNKSLLIHHAKDVLAKAGTSREHGGPGLQDGGPGLQDGDGVGRNHCTVGEEMTDTDREAEYAVAFGKALQKACSAKRLVATDVVPVRSNRPSAKLPSVSCATPWTQAQVDVYSLIVDKMQREHGSEAFYPVGDVFQSADRGTVKIAGDLPGISKSTTWFDFADGTFVQPQALFAVQGFAASELDLGGLSDSETTALAGNAMASTSAVVALTPVLRALGYLQRTP
jgi:hypothetical protein